jgi:hypothetical protein
MRQRGFWKEQHAVFSRSLSFFADALRGIVVCGVMQGKNKRREEEWQAVTSGLETRT